jgi:hypothetical protein
LLRSRFIQRPFNQVFGCAIAKLLGRNQSILKEADKLAASFRFVPYLVSL